MAEALITIKLNPAEFKLVTSALAVAEQESQIAANNADNPRNKAAHRAEQAQFGELLKKLS